MAANYKVILLKRVDSGAPHCPGCVKAEGFLKKLQVDFKIDDIAKKEYSEQGYMRALTLPIIILKLYNDNSYIKQRIISPGCPGTKEKMLEMINHAKERLANERKK